MLKNLNENLEDDRVKMFETRLIGGLLGELHNLSYEYFKHVKAARMKKAKFFDRKVRRHGHFADYRTDKSEDILAHLENA
jgi:hypothetical protein